MRGEAYRRKGEYDRAIADFDRAIELNPKDTWALTSRGDVYIKTRAFSDAEADFDRALELDPSNQFAKNGLKRLIAVRQASRSGAETELRRETAQQLKSKTNKKIELSFWNTVKDSKDPAFLKLYLDRYPNGIFSTIAKVRIERLEAQ